MELNPESKETARLLSELDLAIEQLSAMRDIVTSYEKLHQLESITGPCQRTREMRREIEIMENRFNGERKSPQSEVDIASDPG